MNYRINIVGRLSVVLGLAFAMFSCEGMFSGIYDEPTSKTDNDNTKNVYGFTSYDENTRRGTIYLNLSDYDKWFYLSVEDKKIDTVMIPQNLTQTWDGKSGIHYHYIHGLDFSLDKVIRTDAQINPSKWDFALHRYEAKVNGGAIQTNYSSLDELPLTSESFDNANYVADELIDTLVMTDISQMFAYYIGYQNIECNRVLSDWLRMDISNPPPVYQPSNKVYILRLLNNQKIALHFDSYMSANGTKGFVTISFIYPY